MIRDIRICDTMKVSGVRCQLSVDVFLDFYNVKREFVSYMMRSAMSLVPSPSVSPSQVRLSRPEVSPSSLLTALMASSLLSGGVWTSILW